MADLLRSDRDLAPSFLNSVLNQLNWAFSEFIGMIQEVSVVPGAAGSCTRWWPVSCTQRGSRHESWGWERSDSLAHMGAELGLGSRSSFWEGAPCEAVSIAWQIQQAAERLERNFVDSRQLKVCATCFDLSVSLLRVLEMTVTLAPEIFLDWNRPSSELLLRRLAQVSSSHEV